MDKLDQAIAALKTENKRLGKELKQARSPIAALQGITNNGRGIKGRLSGRTMSASARRRIAAAQKARWTKWRAAIKVDGGRDTRDFMADQPTHESVSVTSRADGLATDAMAARRKTFNR